MRVLFSCFPAQGHLLPMLPLALAARQAGHEVVVASGADLAAVVERFGLAFWPVGPSLAEASARFLAEHPDADLLPAEQRIPHDIAGLFEPSAELRAADLVPRAVAWSPHLVVHEMTEFAGAVAAAHTGARHAVHGISLLPPGVLELFTPVLAKVFTPWNVPELVDGLLDATYLDVIPAALQPSGPADFRRVQPLRPTAGVVPAGAAGLPVDLSGLRYADTVYVTLGTVFNGARDVFREVLAGLASLAVNVVVTLGADADPAGLGALPEQVSVLGYVPQALLLPYCHLVVSHGGGGSVAGALCNGLPQLVLPQGADNFLNASAVAGADAGLALPPDAVTASAVAEAARRLLAEPAFTAAARSVRSQIAAMPSAEEVLPVLLTAAPRASLGG